MPEGLSSPDRRARRRAVRLDQVTRRLPTREPGYPKVSRSGEPALPEGAPARWIDSPEGLPTLWGNLPGGVLPLAGRPKGARPRDPFRPKASRSPAPLRVRRPFVAQDRLFSLRPFHATEKFGCRHEHMWINGGGFCGQSGTAQRAQGDALSTTFFGRPPSGARERRQSYLEPDRRSESIRHQGGQAAVMQPRICHHFPSTPDSALLWHRSSDKAPAGWRHPGSDP